MRVSPNFLPLQWITVKGIAREISVISGRRRQPGWVLEVRRSLPFRGATFAEPCVTALGNEERLRDKVSAEFLRDYLPRFRRRAYSTFLMIAESLAFPSFFARALPPLRSPSPPVTTAAMVFSFSTRSGSRRGASPMLLLPMAFASRFTSRRRFARLVERFDMNPALHWPTELSTSRRSLPYRGDQQALWHLHIDHSRIATCFAQQSGLNSIRTALGRL